MPVARARHCFVAIITVRRPLIRAPGVRSRSSQLDQQDPRSILWWPPPLASGGGRPIHLMGDAHCVGRTRGTAASGSPH